MVGIERKSLVDGVMHRDESAFREVIQTYTKLLWAVAGSILNGCDGYEQDVEECVSDVFIYLWNNVKQFDPVRGSLKSYLVEIAKSNAINRYYKKSRERLVQLEDYMEKADEEKQLEAKDYSRLYGSTQGLKVPNIYNMGNSIDPVITQNTLTQYLRNSVFGSIGIGFDETYYLDVTAREDISSALPTEHNSYFYPSVSGSVILSRLFDMPSSAFLKLRGSWSNVRSDLEPYAYMTTYQPGITYGQYNAMQYPSTLGNMMLRPSTTNGWV